MPLSGFLSAREAPPQGTQVKRDRALLESPVNECGREALHPPTHKRMVDGYQYHRSHYRPQDGAYVQPVYPVEAQQPPYEAADEATNDADYGGDYYPVVSGSRYDVLGHYPRDEPYYDPGYDPHLLAAPLFRH